MFEHANVFFIILFSLRLRKRPGVNTHVHIRKGGVRSNTYICLGLGVGLGLGLNFNS